MPAPIWESTFSLGLKNPFEHRYFFIRLVWAAPFNLGEAEDLVETHRPRIVRDCVDLSHQNRLGVVLCPLLSVLIELGTPTLATSTLSQGDSVDVGKRGVTVTEVRVVGAGVGPAFNRMNIIP